ncbi:MAG: isoleucine--tRNA ligase, partial [Nitriliruptor sp.]
HEIAEELNVHDIELADGTGELVERSCKPNFRALGPVFQKRAPEVAGAISALDPEAAAALAEELRAGEAQLTVGNDEVTITPEMVEVIERPRTGWAVARDATSSFALDTALTRELEVEGAARELVRAINELRKAAGLELADRIELVISIDPPELDRELGEAGHYDAIARDVLATAVHRAPVADGTPIDLGELGAALVAIRS